MSTLSYNGLIWEVDHAVKGTNYVHGYSSAGLIIVSIEDTTDFDNIEYDGPYLAPEECLNESCNDVKYVNGSLVRRDGTVVSDIGTAQNVTAIDFTNLESGSFTETLEDGTVNTYNVTYDANGRPISIGDVTLVWPEVV